MGKIKIIIGICSVLLSYNGYSQSDSILSNCSQHIVKPFISDGQLYRALLNGDEIAEFYATFYSGNTYRISACSGFGPGNLIFKVYDENRKFLFSNQDFDNAPYWDLTFNSTLNCIIEAKLDTRNVKSGFAIIMIGFKQ